MARPSKLWWRSERNYWCSEVNGKLHVLAHGKQNKVLAQRMLDQVLAQQRLLSECRYGVMAVAALAEMFLEFVVKHRASSTYALYRDNMQQFVDRFGMVKAHEITARHIDQWTASLQDRGLSSTTILIKLKTVLACWNWAVRKE